MGSWITCRCGASIHTNLFAGTAVYRLVSDSDYDSLEEPVDRGQVEDLFFNRGIPAYRCKRCGRLAVQWDRERAPEFYAPEGREEPSAAGPASAQGDPGDDQRLKDLEALAEAEYERLYESRSPTAAYSNVKEAFYTAIEWAEKLRRRDVADRLRKRLQDVKEVFRRQFP